MCNVVDRDIQVGKGSVLRLLTSSAYTEAIVYSSNPNIGQMYPPI